MSHNIEFVDGKACIAYAGEVPWHGLGKKVLPDLTPSQILQEAGLDWEVYKEPAFAIVGGKKVAVGKSALVRSSDHSVLDVVSSDWNPMQNSEAFDFFQEYVMAGDLEMHTAGSLKDGQLVWALAKTKESFTLFKNDTVEQYLLFTNPHMFGKSIDVRFTNVRVVCNNTLTLAHEEKTKKMVKVTHRREFDAESVKETLGIARTNFGMYKETAKFLGSKRFTDATVRQYFNEVFPLVTSKRETKKESSRNARIALEILDAQPGAEYARGSWWQAVNAVTFMNSHVIGRSKDNRVASMWYGKGADINQTAMIAAIKYAEMA